MEENNMNIELKKNSRGRITKINNEAILNRLGGNIFVTERSINDYVKSFNIYDLNKNELIAEYRNSIAGVYTFSYRDAVNHAEKEYLWIRTITLN
jgi:hypothetical protein